MGKEDDPIKTNISANPPAIWADTPHLLAAASLEDRRGSFYTSHSAPNFRFLPVKEAFLGTNQLPHGTLKIRLYGIPISQTTGSPLYKLIFDNVTPNF
jgi:hypothetical protein